MSPPYLKDFKQMQNTKLNFGSVVSCAGENYW